MASNSVQLREQGNEEFRKSKEAALSTEQKWTHLDQAVSLYQSSYKAAVDDGQRASAAKNIAKATLLIVPLLKENLDVQVENIKTTISYIYKAKKHGTKSDKSDRWMAELDKSLEKCLQHCRSVLRRVDQQKVLDVAQGFISVIFDEVKKCNVFSFLLERVLPYCVNELNKGVYGESLGYLRECSVMLDDIHISQDHEGAIQDLTEKLNRELCRAKALQTLHRADMNVEEILRSSNTLNPDVIYEVIDWYTEVIRATEDKQMETTSRAYYGLVLVYTELLKDAKRAEECRFKAEAFKINNDVESLKRAPLSLSPEEDGESKRRKTESIDLTDQPGVPSASSEAAREEGNKWYKKALENTSSEREDCLRTAMKHYKTAFNKAKDLTEKAKASRNMATATFKICQNGTKTLTDTLVECLKYINNALSYGEMAQMARPWIRALCKQYTDVINFSCEMARNMDTRSAVNTLEVLLPHVKENELKVEVYKEIITALYVPSVKELDRRQYGVALGFLQEAQETIDFATRLDIPNNKKLELKSLTETVAVQKSRAKAIQLLQRADDNFLTILKKRSEIKSFEDANYELVDWYGRVIKMTDGIGEVQREYLQACWRLSQLYKYIFMDHDRAEKYRKLSLQHVSETDAIDQFLQNEQLKVHDKKPIDQDKHVQDISMNSMNVSRHQQRPTQKKRTTKMEQSEIKKQTFNGNCREQERLQYQQPRTGQQNWEQGRQVRTDEEAEQQEVIYRQEMQRGHEHHLVEQVETAQQCEKQTGAKAKANQKRYVKSKNNETEQLEVQQPEDNMEVSKQKETEFQLLRMFQQDMGQKEIEQFRRSCDQQNKQMFGQYVRQQKKNQLGKQVEVQPQLDHRRLEHRLEHRTVQQKSQNQGLAQVRTVQEQMKHQELGHNKTVQQQLVQHGLGQDNILQQQKEQQALGEDRPFQHLMERRGLGQDNTLLQDTEHPRLEQYRKAGRNKEQIEHQRSGQANTVQPQRDHHDVRVNRTDQQQRHVGFEQYGQCPSNRERKKVVQNTTVQPEKVCHGSRKESAVQQQREHQMLGQIRPVQDLDTQKLLIPDRSVEPDKRHLWESQNGTFKQQRGNQGLAQDRLIHQSKEQAMVHERAVLQHREQQGKAKDRTLKEQKVRQWLTQSTTVQLERGHQVLEQEKTVAQQKKQQELGQGKTGLLKKDPVRPRQDIRVQQEKDHQELRQDAAFQQKVYHQGLEQYDFQKQSKHQRQDSILQQRMKHQSQSQDKAYELGHQEFRQNSNLAGFAEVGSKMLLPWRSNTSIYNSLKQPNREQKPRKGKSKNPFRKLLCIGKQD